MQVEDTLSVTGDTYAGKVTSPLVQAFAFESDTLRPNVNPGVTVEGDLHVTGNISYNSLTSIFWIAGSFDRNGVVYSQKGRYPFTVTKP